MVLAISISGMSSAGDGLDILLVGDSITEGQGAVPGFRSDLPRLLDDLLPPSLKGQVEFIGSAGTLPPHGHFRSGATTDEFYPSSSGTRGRGTFPVTADLALARAPTLVAIHLGTNDLSLPPPHTPYSLDHGRTLEATRSAALTELIAHIAAERQGRGMLLPIVVSLIIPAADRDESVRAWNEQIIAMAEDFAEGAATGGPVPIALADHHARFRTNPDLMSGGPGDWMTDALHPNAAGYREMARVYAAAIAAAATDTIPPDAAADLRVVETRMDQITLAVTASGDDGRHGRAARYDLRLAAVPIGTHNFGGADQALAEPIPGPAGTTDTLRVRGLTPGTGLYFALKIVDDAGNRSPVSNPVAAATAGTGRTTVTLQEGIDGYRGTSDTTIFSGQRALNQGVRSTIEIGATPRDDVASPGAASDVNRTLIRFDLSPIPRGATVHTARLRLHCWGTGAWEPVTITAHRMSQTWVEGTQVYADEEDAASWNELGAQNSGPPIARAVLDAGRTRGNEWLEWDVTSTVADWVGGEENHGFLLRAADETQASNLWLYSAEYPASAALRPQLRMDYSLDGNERSTEP